MQGIKHHKQAITGGSVICTEIYNRGDMSEAIWEADIRFGIRQPLPLMTGYLLLAKPLVKLMQHSELVYKAIRVPALRWVDYMAYKEGLRDKTDLIGAAIFNIGAPVCYLLGSIVLAFRPQPRQVDR